MIKGWYAKHKDTGKWHKIEDVKDTGIPAHKEGGGNNYHLEGIGPVHQSKIADMQEKPPMEKTDKLKGGLADKKKPSDFDPKQLAMGIKVEMEHTKDKSLAQEIAMDHLTEDPQYYTKLKEVEKYDRVDMEADGKRELDYGKEELEKPCGNKHMSKSILERWLELKKAISDVDSDSAFLDITSQEYQDEEDQDQNDDDQGGDPGQLPGGPEDESGDGEDVQDVGEVPDDEEPAGDEEGDGSSPSEQEIIQMLQDEGYSDAEIAHIVHGHIPPQTTVDDIKMQGEQAENENDQAIAEHELDHKKRMSDLEYETAQQEQGINELDRDHKKRMLDLEYDAARREKEMELDYKKKELEQKLKNSQDKHQQSLKAKKDADKSRALDAGKTSKTEKAGK